MGDFMPHGHCYLWKPALVWLEVGTNGLIGLSYVAISATLAHLVRRGQYVPFKGMALAFGIFIVTCGLTHFMDVYEIWHPIYWIDAATRAVTAAASVITAVMLPFLIPRALALSRGAKAMRERGIELEAAIADLGTLYEKTKELEELKTQFFANVSHELRTPLALISGPAERILARSDESQEVRDDADLILRNARTLLKHVNDMLDVSRLEAGKVAPRYARTDVTQLVRVLASNFDGVAAERRTRFVVEPGPSVVADIDPDQLRRILLNLLSNAFKFTTEGSTVRCTLRLDGDPTPAHLVLEVADSGPGIRPEHRKIVFERFRQVDGSAARGFGGTGLGLAIVKELVELQHGSVSIHEAPEGGALLRVVLPLSAPEGVSTRSVTLEAKDVDEETLQALEDLRVRADLPKERKGDDRPLVLVIEDNTDMNRFVCESLEPAFRTESALDGATGVEKALALAPDLVLSDIMMAGMTGDVVLRKLREERSMDTTPIVLLTAKADGELRVRLLEEGAQDYLMKPFAAGELRARVANLIGTKRVRAILQAELDTQTRDLEQLASEIALKSRELQTALASMRIAREHAERASQLKSSFLSMVSHELRTPLASLMLQLERMLLGEDLPLPKRDLTRRMMMSAGRLQGLIEGLLHYAEYEGGKPAVRHEPVELRVLLQDVIDEALPIAERKGIALSLEADEVPLVESDPEILRLIAINLVGNGIKFTQEGAVRVQLSYDGGAHRITVTDTGPGIPRDLQPRIFDPFVQGEQVRNKHFAGVGLGLTLVREMTSSVGGSILLDSEPGRGTAFTVVLPERNR